MGSLGQTHTHCYIYNKEGPTVSHGDLCSIFGNNLNGKELEKNRYMCICNRLTLLYTRTNTLLLNYTLNLKILRLRLKINF